MLFYNIVSTCIFSYRHLGMDPFVNIAWKCQARIEGNGSLGCIGLNPRSCCVDLLIYMKTHMHLFMCSATPFFCTKINCFLSMYFIFSQKSTVVEIQAAS